MSRWRDIKQSTVKKETEVSQTQEIDNSLLSAPIGLRIKAFVVDMFMIMMPIMYVTTYLILEGKDDFQGSEEARWITASVYGIIVIFFWVIKGQTPGYKAYSVKLIDNTKKRVSLFKAILRYFLFLFSATTIILSFLPFFRKDRKTIQDILTKTTVILDK